MKPGLRSATIFRTSLLLLILVLLAACSGRTRYSLEYRALSSIPQEFISREVDLPGGNNRYLYLLPFAAIADSSSSIDIVLRRGTELQYPVPEVPEGGDIELSLELGMAIENLSTGNSLPEVSARLFIATADSGNIYTEGSPVFSFSSGQIGAEQSGRITGRKYIRQGDPGWNLLISGDIRCGVEVRFTADADNALQLRYTLDTLRLRISAYPFAFLP